MRKIVRLLVAAWLWWSGANNPEPSPWIDFGLAQPYEAAVQAWAPHKADVREVRFCRGEAECQNQYGALAMWVEASRTIWVKNIAVWPAEDGLTTTIMHEYGHALGLAHATDGEASIMRPDWSELQRKPTARDLAAAEALEGRK
jgi:hypothetical protein